MVKSKINLSQERDRYHRGQHRKNGGRTSHFHRISYAFPRHPFLTNPLNQIGCCEAIIAIFLPPLAVLLRKGCSGSLLINIVLTILGWIPGVIHAWFVIAADPGLRRKNTHHHSSTHHYSSHSRPHSRPHSSHSTHGHHSHHHGSSSSHAGHHHHHHGSHSHTGRHHARPARKSYDRPAYRDGYGAAPPSRYGIGAPPPEMGYAAPPPRMGYRY